MAFPTSTFSIREYALEMRGKDIAKSWPFSGSVKEEVAKALLPPISVTKFRWWSHELEILRSNHAETEDKLICPICGVFVTVTVNAMNAHMDSCLVLQTTKYHQKITKNKASSGRGVLKTKSKPPKKRSIAEIFAVAPPVETMIKGNNRLKATSLARTLVSAMKTIKSKNKNKNKEFGHEQVCKKGQRNHKNGKKPCLKRLLSKQKMQKLVKKSNVGIKQQRPVPTIRSILKHGTVKVVSETNPSSTNLKWSTDDQVINNHCDQKSDRRRVSFSDKDDVLGPSTRAFNSDTFQQNDHVNPFQLPEGNNSTNSSVSYKGVGLMEVGVNDDVFVSVNTRQKVDSQHMKGKIRLPNNVHDQVINAQCSMSPHPCWDNVNRSTSTEKLISENRGVPSLHLFDHVYADSPQKLTSVHSALLASQDQERQYGRYVSTRCGSSFPRPHSFYGKSVDHLMNPVNEVAALDSVTSTLPSFALSENAVGRYVNLDDSSAKDTQSRFSNWEQSAVAYEKKGENDGLFCLPLNSKGELIHLNSGLINEFDQMNEASINMACSSRMPVCGLVLPRSSRDYFIDNDKFLVDTKLTGNQLPLFPLHSNMQEHQNRYLSAGFDATEPGTSETVDIRLMNADRGTESCRFFHSNLMDHPLNRCRYYGKDYPDNSSSMMANPARQTMRLMGKDVAVGGNGKEVQEPEVINFWKNSALIENSLTNPIHIQENPMRQRNFVQDRVFYPGFHGNQVAQRNFLPNAPQVRYPHPRLDRKNSLQFQRSNSVINLNERFNNIHNPNRYENSFEQGTFNFPFLQPDDHENHVQLPCFHSSKSLPPPWMLHGHQRQDAPPASSKLADINGYYCPFISSATHVLTSPPCGTMPPHFQMKNIPASTSYFQPIPVATRVQPPSIRMSSEDRYYDLSSKKRRVAELDNLRKHQKMPSLEMNNAGVVPGWTGGKFNNDAQSNPGITAKMHPKVECMGRSGPIKLTAGAKHILKPNQSYEERNLLSSL